MSSVDLTMHLADLGKLLLPSAGSLAVCPKIAIAGGSSCRGIFVLPLASPTWVDCVRAAVEQNEAKEKKERRQSGTVRAALRTLQNFCHILLGVAAHPALASS